MKRRNPAILTTVLVLCGLIGYFAYGPKLSTAWSFKQARTLFDQALAANRFQNAYDLLLTASRIDATQPDLLDCVQRFVESARKAGDNKAAELADLPP